jgi:hypothetical protein
MASQVQPDNALRSARKQSLESNGQTNTFVRVLPSVRMVMYATKRAHSLGSLSTRHLQRRTPDSCCNITEDEQFLALRASSGFGTVRFRCKNAKISYELV